MTAFRPHIPSDAPATEALFISVFTRSESESEGILIGNLAKELMAGTDRRDLYGFVAVDREQIIGSIFFSRLAFEMNTKVFVLSPVAIHSDYQGLGIGQNLINHGLSELKRSGVKMVVTYGDPAFYSKVGFHPISEDTVRAPFKLSQPEGWLGQSLTGTPIETIPGRCSCVKALNKPAYW
jgi:predicted N-acetyltransferase YhbS